MNAKPVSTCPSCGAMSSGGSCPRGCGGRREAGTTPLLVDCTHLHSAFGPGCPYCWTPRRAA